MSKVNVVPKRPPVMPPMTPEQIRKNIGTVEQEESRIQTEILQRDRGKLNILQLNRFMMLLDGLKRNKEQLYFMLHQMEVQGKIKEERLNKQIEDWEKHKCPKCEQAKLDERGVCPKCGYIEEVPARLDTPFTKQQFEVGKQLEENERKIEE